MLAAFLTISATTAQNTGKIKVNPGILTEGGTAEIEVIDPTRAGQSIVVTVFNGAPSYGNPQYQYVEIQIDDDGRGTGTWPVPNDPSTWWGAEFSAPGCDGTTRPIQPAPRPPGS